jgi:hypothetical protein
MRIRTRKRKAGYFALSAGITLSFCPALNNVENAFMSSLFSGSSDRALNS